MKIDGYPTIKKAALMIAYDNGMINRESDEEAFLAEADSIIGADGVYEHDLILLEQFLSDKDEGQLETICCGEHFEQEELCLEAPLTAEGFKVTGLLNDFMDGRLT